MTSTDRIAAGGVLSIAAERANALAIPEARGRGIALLRVGVLAHILRCQRAIEVSRVCSRRTVPADNARGGTVMVRPFDTWTCCDTHRELAAERAALLHQAALLGLELRFEIPPQGSEDLPIRPDSRGVFYVDVLRAVGD